MIARVLIINENDANLDCITENFERRFCPILVVRSLESALRIIGREQIDLVLLSVNDINNNYLADFFAILRIVVGIVPILAISSIGEKEDFSKWSNYGIDAIIPPDIEEDDLFRKTDSLLEAKGHICSALITKDSLGEQLNKKVIIISKNNLRLFDKNFTRNAQISYLHGITKPKEFDLADIILIDINIKNALQLCAKLKLKSKTKHKPVILLFDKDKQLALSMFEKKIGFLDIIDIKENTSVISCKINAHIKYKRLLDEFYEKVRKNIYLSSIDTLTEVYNRSFLEDYICHREFALKHSAILMINLDKFKIINDDYGHTFADKVLRSLVMCLKSYVRPTDIIARYGGDEFIIFMRNVSKSEVISAATRLRENIASTSFNGISCTISVGICWIEVDKMNLREAISVADRSMYASKQCGGNTVRIHG